jgi:hypothetical protein
MKKPDIREAAYHATTTALAAVNQTTVYSLVVEALFVGLMRAGILKPDLAKEMIENVTNSIMLSPDIDEGTRDEMLTVLKRMIENVGGTILPPSGRSGTAGEA